MFLKLGVILIFVSVVIGEIARQIRVRRDASLRAVPFSLGLSGADFARLLLRLRGLEGVRVIESGHLVTDHYVPGAKVLRLAPQNFHGINLAAAGIAAHEVGHAIQDADGYHPLQWRQTVIRLAYYGSFASFMISVLPIIVERPLGIFLLGACWMFIRANSLATLPVEMNATFRVSSLIRGQRLLSAGREWKQLTEMMGAAELDKVSGFLKTAHFLVTRIVFWRRR